MALVTPDYTDAQDQIEPGEYFTRITKCEQKTSQKGSQYLNWTLETFNEDDSKNNGRMVWYTTMLEGRGAGMLKQFIKTITGEEPGAKFDTDEMIGKEMKAVLMEDGQGRVNIKAIKAIH